MLIRTTAMLAVLMAAILEHPQTEPVRELPRLLSDDGHVGDESGGRRPHSRIELDWSRERGAGAE
jgi:hypothetical protein